MNVPKTTRMARMAIRLGVVAAIAAGGGVASAAPAVAGSNGQQVYIDGGPSKGFATLIGPNQHDSTTVSPTIWLDDNGYGQLNNWWWKGNVEVHIWNRDGSYTGARRCAVPASQWWSNWTKC